MNKITDMNQLTMEMQFSKRTADFIAIDNFIGDTGKLMSDLVDIINTWRMKTFWPEKQILVNNLPETNDIVIEIMLVILTTEKPTPIQGIAIEIGSRLGYHDIIEAAKIGTSIVSVIALNNDDLIHIDLYQDKTIVTPKLQIDTATKKKIKSLSYMPPNLVPANWQSNYGGWQWEKKSVILGTGNHHDEPQELGVLNMLQQIPWVIDMNVVISTDETKENLPHEWREILGSYIGEEFYFTYRYDKRGRIYSSGYQLNPQSNEFGKAILSPKNGEKMTQEGYEALVDYHADLLSDGKRILAEKMWDTIYEVNKYPGKSINVFMELDASQSGYQIMACLSNCTKTAKLCNLTSEPTKQDLYKEILDRVEDRISSNFGYTRKEVKKAIMTAAYNSKAKPAELFGEHVDVFWEVLGDSCPGAMEVMDIINACWNPNVLEHSWVMPDGHVVKVKVMEKTDIRVTIPELNDRKITFTYNKNTPSNNGRSLVPNVVHSIDAYVCREMIRRCGIIGIQIAPIHDCFLFHPNHAEQVKGMYRTIMSEIADPHVNILNNICSQIIGYDAGIKINDEGLSNEILNSTYALT